MPPACPRPLAPADNFRFRSVSAVQLSGDGDRLLALLTARDPATDRRVTSLIEHHDDAWHDVAGSEGVFAFHFAPSGRDLAVLRREDDSWGLALRRDGIWRELHRAATPLREIAFSPDGKWIAFQQRLDAPPPAWLGLASPPEGASWAPPPRHTARLMWRHDAFGELPEGSYQIFVVPADFSAPARQISHGAWHFGMPHHQPPGLVFSADGTRLLVAASDDPKWDRAPTETDLWAFPLDGGAPTRLTAIAGATARPTPSPDGRWIAFTAVEQRGLCLQLRRLYVMPAGGGAAREILPGFDRSIIELAWDAAGALLVSYDDRGETMLARVTLDGAREVIAHGLGSGQIEKPYGGAGPFSVAREGSLAWITTRGDLPSEVVRRTPDGQMRTLTSLNAELAAEVGGFVPAMEFEVATPSGRRVQAWVLRPRTPGPHPVVLAIHGGPFAQFGDRFSIKFQMLVAAGYAVLYANPAGSTGYGEDFANALHDRFPGPDYEDLIAVLDAALARPDFALDPARQFVGGTSGGGVLTLWAASHTERFRAGVSIKPVVNWESWVLQADIGPTTGRLWMGGALPWEDPAKYRARSPLSWAEATHTPLLLMGGLEDARTPLSETIQMYSALRLAGVEAELLRFPQTPHGTSAMRPSLFTAEVAAEIGWFHRFR
jgi:acylaminoacyl-peptidase